MDKLYEQALIIDDDVDLCNLLQELLSKSIPKVSHVHTLEAGRNFINEYKADIIFLDNNLPDGQGVDLIPEIKTRSAESLVIVISAIGNAREQALSWGADVILEKPLTSANITEILEEAHVNFDATATPKLDTPDLSALSQ